MKCFHPILPRHKGSLAWCWVWLFLCGAAPAADVIIVGSGGSPEYRSKFADWTSRLAKILVEKLDHPPSEIHLLREEDGDGGVTLPRIQNLFQNLAKNHSRRDDLFVYLVGHGSFLRGLSKFHIPGPDLDAAELERLIRQVPAKRVVVFNTASASAGFINALSGGQRILCTATRDVNQQNATEFMAFFIQALEEGIADLNRDERISVWEACQQAAALTQAWYAANGWIPTEHALLDDNGDGLGTRLYVESGVRQPKKRDGALARQCFLKDFSFPDTVPREVIERYLSLLEGIEQLKSRKDQLAEDPYYRQLESELIKAAKVHREIRRLGQATPPDG